MQHRIGVLLLLLCMKIVQEQIVQRMLPDAAQHVSRFDRWTTITSSSTATGIEWQTAQLLYITQSSRAIITTDHRLVVWFAIFLPPLSRFYDARQTHLCR
uniref:Putative secreted protein n=1 Tax=Anopheles darlingi TaxID=43151 RepID=A0A2M4DKS4_ANODA